MRKLGCLILILLLSLSPSLYASNIGSTSTVIQDAGGDKISLTSSGLVNIHDADHHINLINEYAHYHTGTTSTLSVGTVAGATSISIQGGDYASFTVGDRINLTSTGGAQESDRAIITAKPGSPVLTLNKPLDIAYDIGNTVEIVTFNLAAAAGTLAAPRVYEIYPPPNEVWHLNTLTISALDNAQPDDGNMFGATAFTNGIVIRSNKSGVYRTLAVWKSNQDIIADTFDVEYRQKSGGGDWGTRGRWEFRKVSGSIIRLDGATNDRVEILVQDNPTALISINMKFEGHLEE